MKINVLTVAILSICLSGCVGTLLEPVPLSNNDRAQFLSAEPVVVTMQKTPGFLFNTPAGALVNAGTATWLKPEEAPSWPRITAQYGIPDFTDAVRSKFVSSLERSLGPRSIETAADRLPFSEKQEFGYVARYDADYVLEFRTQYGSFHYLPLQWKTYAMNCTGQARIIRVSDQQVVWNATCSVGASDNPSLKVPAKDFLEGDGKLLKQAATFVTDSCTDQLLGQFVSAN